MAFSLDDIAAKAVGALVIAFGALLGGMHIRRKASSIGAANAQDAANISRANAEADYFSNALDELRKSAEHWQELHATDTERLRSRLEQERGEQAQALLQERKVSADLRDQLLAKAAEIVALQAEMRHERSASHFRVRVLRARHPEIDFDLLDTGHGDLTP